MGTVKVTYDGVYLSDYIDKIDGLKVQFPMDRKRMDVSGAWIVELSTDTEIARIDHISSKILFKKKYDKYLSAVIYAVESYAKESGKDIAVRVSDSFGFEEWYEGH